MEQLCIQLGKSKQNEARVSRPLHLAAGACGAHGSLAADAAGHVAAPQRCPAGRSGRGGAALRPLLRPVALGRPAGGAASPRPHSGRSQSRRLGPRRPGPLSTRRPSTCGRRWRSPCGMGSTSIRLPGAPPRRPARPRSRAMLRICCRLHPARSVPRTALKDHLP